MKTGNFNTKLNSIPFGMLVGLLVALLASYIIFYFKNTTSLALFEDKHKLYIYAPYLKYGGIFNLAPFYIFNHFDMLNAQRGVIMSTIILFIFVVVITYIL